MAEYVKLFFITHFHYWYIYLFSIAMFFVACIVTIVFLPFSIAIVDSNRLAHILSALIFAAIACGLFLLPNYMVAKEYVMESNLVNVLLFTVFNQFFFMLPIFVGAYWILKTLIFEF
ncbi:MULTISPECIES: hypothetical protein [Bacillaceae]|uniref:Uncharacterized protein n=1 Tax=Evansella alkalicola TaxID=745819 RepID=A0ABS6JY65_9BACI|nr:MULTISPECIES: hypothetical protein [Bacillaceae]MBU9723527.1 hypothetical protein [Bacillus alkalicola]